MVRIQMNGTGHGLPPVALKLLAFTGGTLILIGVYLIASARSTITGFVLMAAGVADLAIAAVFARRH